MWESAALLELAAMLEGTASALAAATLLKRLLGCCLCWQSPRLVWSWPCSNCVMQRIPDWVPINIP